MTQVLKAGREAAARPSAPAGFAPYIPAGQSPPEITLRAIIIGCVIGIVYGAANAYLGLLAGQTV